MRQIVVLTIKEAVTVLREAGMQISEPHLRAGIECGAYPFGVCVRMDKHPTFEVYRPLLMQWIAERSEDVA